MGINNNNAKIAADISQTLEYQNLLGKISDTYTQGKFRAHQAVNTHLIETYWQIGQYIVEYPISQMPSHQLSWSHYVELLKLDNDLERCFYEKQAIAERWSVAELKRQKASALFLRLAAGKDKEEILRLAAQGQLVEQPTDIL